MTTPHKPWLVRNAIVVALCMAIMGGLLLMVMVSLSSCAPRFYPYKRPTDTELPNRTPH